MIAWALTPLMPNELVPECTDVEGELWIGTLCSLSHEANELLT